MRGDKGSTHIHTHLIHGHASTYIIWRDGSKYLLPLARERSEGFHRRSSSTGEARQIFEAETSTLPGRDRTH